MIFKRLASATILSLLPATFAGGDTPWSYHGENGPQRWGALDPCFAVCATGRNQSPIDVTGAIEAKLPPIVFTDGSRATEILHNGYTVQVGFAAGSSIALDGRTFELLQLHFHAPSENHVGGRSFPMEGHFVHSDAVGNLAVVGVMFEMGETNLALARLWAQLPQEEGEVHELEADFKPGDLRPAPADYFRFSGSLTTPPCTEGVRWLLLKEAVPVSGKQVKAFEAVLHHPNNRPLQPVGARPVLQ